MHLTLHDRKSTFEAINVARCYATSPKPTSPKRVAWQGG